MLCYLKCVVLYLSRVAKQALRSRRPLEVGDSEPSYVSQNNFLIFYIILNPFFMYSLDFTRKSLYEWFLEMDGPKFWI